MGGCVAEQSCSPHCCEVWEWVEGGGQREEGLERQGREGSIVSLCPEHHLSLLNLSVPLSC